MTLLLTYAAISIFFSFLCSILEAVLLSVTPTFIKIKMNEGKTYAKTLEELKKAFGSGNNMVGIVSAIMTFLILIVSEIIPKTIGATYWKQLANFTSKVLVILIFPLKWTGLLWLMQITTKLIGKNSHGSILSREDFSVMTEIAFEKGVFEEAESKIIQNLINFKSILAKDIMTPRTVIKMIDENQTLEEYYSANKDLQFSRIPIYSKNTDNITGYILKDDLLKSLAEDKHSMKVSDLKRQMIFVTKNTSIPLIFEKFMETKEHIALITDDFGSVIGLVTMEDVIETLLGMEIIDEHDKHEDMQQLARKKWKERAKKYGLLDEEES